MDPINSSDLAILSPSPSCSTSKPAAKSRLAPISGPYSDISDMPRKRSRFDEAPSPDTVPAPPQTPNVSTNDNGGDKFDVAISSGSDCDGGLGPPKGGYERILPSILGEAIQALPVEKAQELISCEPIRGVLIDALKKGLLKEDELLGVFPVQNMQNYH
jgi:hypothetical protein